MVKKVARALTTDSTFGRLVLISEAFLHFDPPVNNYDFDASRQELAF